MQRIDYANGKIYRITDLNNTIEYIGSTCEDLNTRFNRHKQKYRAGRYCNGSVFMIFDIFGTNKTKIELIENYPCDDKKQLQTREGILIRKNITRAVNKILPKLHI